MSGKLDIHVVDMEQPMQDAAKNVRNMKNFFKKQHLAQQTKLKTNQCCLSDFRLSWKLSIITGKSVSSLTSSKSNSTKTTVSHAFSGFHRIGPIGKFLTALNLKWSS